MPAYNLQIENLFVDGLDVEKSGDKIEVEGDILVECVNNGLFPSLSKVVIDEFKVGQDTVLESKSVISGLISSSKTVPVSFNYSSSDTDFRNIMLEGCDSGNVWDAKISASVKGIAGIVPGYTVETAESEHDKLPVESISCNLQDSEPIGNGSSPDEVQLVIDEAYVDDRDGSLTAVISTNGISEIHGSNTVARANIQFVDQDGTGTSSIIGSVNVSNDGGDLNRKQGSYSSSEEYSDIRVDVNLLEPEALYESATIDV